MLTMTSIKSDSEDG